MTDTVEGDEQSESSKGKTGQLKPGIKATSQQWKVRLHRLNLHCTVNVCLAAYRHRCKHFLIHRAGLPRHHQRA